jgi:hypothetical protein
MFFRESKSSVWFLLLFKIWHIQTECLLSLLMRKLLQRKVQESWHSLWYSLISSLLIAYSLIRHSSLLTCLRRLSGRSTLWLTTTQWYLIMYNCTQRKCFRKLRPLVFLTTISLWMEFFFLRFILMN